MIKFWETKPKTSGGVTLASVEFANEGEALEYARGITKMFTAVPSRGSYVIADATNPVHTIELGRKGDKTAAGLMTQLTITAR